MRMCQLIVTICADVLRHVLDKYIPPANLPSALQNAQSSLTARGGPLNKQQKNLLYPRGTPAKTISSTDFDISLLYILLRNVAGIAAHSNGWGDTPKTGDNCLSACIEIIRISRNEVNGHNLTGQITDDDFNYQWSVLRSAIEKIETNELSGTSFVKCVDELLVVDLNPVKSAEYTSEILRMEIEEYEMKEMMYAMKGKLDFGNRQFIALCLEYNLTP